MAKSLLRPSDDKRFTEAMKAVVIVAEAGGKEAGAQVRLLMEANWRWWRKHKLAMKRIRQLTGKS